MVWLLFGARFIRFQITPSPVVFLSSNFGQFVTADLLGDVLLREILSVCFLSSIRLRQDLAEVTSRHEQTVKEMRSEVAEMKALLTRVLQNGSAPSLPSLPSIQSLQPPPPQQLAPSETRSPSKRSASSRSHRKKHRRQLNSRSDDEEGDENYQGLPLTDGAPVANELPSVRVLASRALKQHKDDQDQS